MALLRRLNVLSIALADVLASFPAVNKVEPSAARFFSLILTKLPIPDVLFRKLIISVPFEMALSSK